jgi:hypothetical protein
MARTFRSEEQLRIQVISPNGSHLTDNIVTSTANDGTVTVNINGNLVVSGANAQVTNTEVEDAIMLLNRGGSAADIDSGIMIDRGSNNNAVFYWNEGDDVFKAVTSTSGADATSITDTALAKIQAGEPTSSSDVATKNYVDTAVSGGSVNFKFVGDDSTGTTINAGETLTITGDTNIASTVTADTVTLTLAQNLTAINSISTGSSNGDLVLTANGTGSVVVDDILTFNSNISTPSASSITKLYSKTAAGGGTGVFFVNSNVNSGTEDELISKKKATALAIALG